MPPDCRLKSVISVYCMLELEEGGGARGTPILDLMGCAAQQDLLLR